MSHLKHLKSAYSKDNIQRAWKWLLTSPDAKYKEYFRHIYTAYSASSDLLIKNLRKKLLNGTYEPSTPSKIFFPKKSGTLRMYTLLTVEDQIVYQAIINIIAEKFAPKVRQFYGKSVFGYLYGGKANFQFYLDWKDSYQKFTKSFIKSYKQGFEWSASFDLTAFYDSIDHKVLHHQLLNLKIEKELCDQLISLLQKWTESQELKQPIHHGHGIPQGPLSSGLLAETLLFRFDTLFKGKTNIKYLRYVDDIRILGKTEKAVRQELVRLDLVSKALGLFPQSGKIDLHKITDIQSELKNISTIKPDEDLAPDNKQKFLKLRFKEHTARYKINDETKIKYLVTQIKPNSVVTKRVIRLLNKYPHMYKSFIGYLSTIRKFTNSTSKDLIETLETNEVYFSYSAAIINLLRDRHHHYTRQKIISICKKRLQSTAIGNKNAELRAAAASFLLKSNGLSWNELQKQLLWPHDWWVRAYIQKFLDINKHGSPNSSFVLNELLTDKVQDPSIIAADIIILSRLPISKPISSINESAQALLKHQKIIQRLSKNNCFVSNCFKEVVGIQIALGKWKRFFNQNYNLILTKMPRWKSSHKPDATSWICITDTINDVILYELCRLDGGIGNYNIGNIGGFIYTDKSAFSKKYPKLREAFIAIHDLRLKADLAHPIVKNTGELTRYITSKEAANALKLYNLGLNEMWAKINSKV